MKPISCAVIDDEPIAREIVENFIRDDDRLNLAGSYKNAKEAISGMQQQPVELIFLDINMPGLTGFQMLKAIQHPPAIIFTTAYREYALDGFDANAIDYLLKPIAVERFLLAVDKAWKFLRPTLTEKQGEFVNHETADSFFVKAEGGLVKLHFSEIVFVESLKEYVRIVTHDKSVITYHTLSGLEDKLPKGQFYRIHRSYLVNIKMVSSVEGLIVRMGSHELPISRAERDDFVHFIANGKIISKK